MEIWGEQQLLLVLGLFRSRGGPGVGALAASADAHARSWSHGLLNLVDEVLFLLVVGSGLN